ncbi:Hypothetical protein FKW44_014097 [Caligus rogercresseyi]|uniref:Uncharacterized protein n=1 Tax=Caligus rogercresseyi TaxID=217165 RepID=A0A7T8GYE0_CALRO|nr:Hypothetical protein FKW44_014097 [Caligus rogercresseyi]
MMILPSHVFPIFNLAAVDILQLPSGDLFDLWVRGNRNWVAIITFDITVTMRKI